MAIKVLTVLMVLLMLTGLSVPSVVAVPAGAQTMPAVPEALEGLDPVLLAQGKEVAGQDRLAVVHGQLKYFFSSVETRAAFEKEPHRYAVQLEGTCARMGAGVVGNPNLYAVHDGRIYLFGSPTCKERFEAAPARYLEPPPSALQASAPERAAGRAALDKTAAAMGALDRMTTFEERTARTLPAQGDMLEREMKTALVWSVPDRLRVEMTFPDFGTVANVVTPSDAFVAMPRAVRPLQRPQALDLWRQALRHPIVLLRTRGTDGFKAAGRGSAIVEVQVAGGPIMSMKLDPASGRPASLSYHGRGPEGDFGGVVIAFGDYRDAEGVSVPFRRTMTFNGAPVPAQTVTVLSVAINKPMDGARFQRPSTLP